MLKLSIIGTGYVGLVSGTMFADFGHDVLCCDNDAAKIQKLEQGVMPIFEPGLKELVQKNVREGRLRFCTDIQTAISHADIFFIAVGTPMGKDHTADLSAVWAAADSIGKYMDRPKIIVDKSTVPVGTSKSVAKLVQTELDRRGAKHTFEVVSNPEFLREGSAISDSYHPDRIVVGCRGKAAAEKLRAVYRPLAEKGAPFIVTTPESAEMIKYACNAFLAVKIAYINELSALCEKTGADVRDVALAMGLDQRIAPQFLQAGPGYGGSCFPKDTNAFSATARQNGLTLEIVDAAIRTNENQKARMADMIERNMGGVAGKTIAFLGVTFKPSTDDMRDAPALVILPELIRRGAFVHVYDPQGMDQAKLYLPQFSDSIRYCGDPYAAASGADAAVLLTHWAEFSQLDFGQLKQNMSGDFFFDLRNMFHAGEVQPHGFRYFGVGRQS